MLTIPEHTEQISYPLVHATVLRTLARMPIFKPEQFVAGTIVRIISDSKFFGLDPATKGPGIIAGIRPDEQGWVYVRFLGATENEIFRNRYRVGYPDLDNGACDLELDTSETIPFAVVSYGGQVVEFPTVGFAVQAGDIVKIDPKANRIISMEKGVLTGNIAFVYRVINDQCIEVDYQGQRRTVFAGKFSGKLEADGRVVLDPTGVVIIENYGLEDDKFSLTDEITVTWDDICGQEEAKTRFREALEMQALHPALYEVYGKKAPNGFLLWGPPGCSKTMLGKAVYTSMAATCKDKGAPLSQGFILVTGPEILSKYVGETEATIRHIFARARKFYKKYSIRPIIMIDECEAIMAKRDSGISSDILRTIVPMFLSQMQGVRESGAIVILATNKPGMLDSAITRPGRMDTLIEIKRPDTKAVWEIFLKNMKKIPVMAGITYIALAGLCVDELFSEKRVIYTIDRLTDAGTPEQVKFCLYHIVSGAMIPTIVEEAKRLALLRDVASGGAVSGICPADVSAAVESIYRQSFSSDHREALGDFTQTFADRVTAVTKLVQAQS